MTLDPSYWVILTRVDKTTVKEFSNKPDMDSFLKTVDQTMYTSIQIISGFTLLKV